MNASEPPFLRSTAAAPPRPGVRPATSEATPTAPELCENFLAPGARFQGTLIVENSIRLEGQFSGEIETRGTLQVAKGADVKARVQARFVVIAGAFNGQIDSRDRLDLLPTSRVKGELRIRRLVVQDGAQFDGKVEMDSSSPA